MAIKQQTKEIVVALAGNPNSGKTTVFNELTGAHQHVGNWPGVTVERKEGTVRRGSQTFRIVDLPGIYSLSAYSQEEVVARDFLLNNKVDVIVNVVDAGSLERNLYLTTQLLELGIGMVIALNMVDMAAKLGQTIDIDKCADFLGVRVVPTQAHKGEGMDDLLRKALEVAQCSACDAPRSARHNPEIESEITKLEQRLQIERNSLVPARWLLVKALEGDAEATQHLARCASDELHAIESIRNTRHHLELVFGDDLEAVIADGRYGFIGGLLREIITHTPTTDRFVLTERIDEILLHRAFGIPIFLFLMWLTFKLTFDVGGHFVQYLNSAVSVFASWTGHALPAGPLSSLLVKGVIPGVGGVIVFLPNIIVMFAIISFLEDSGYMARAAFLMDKAMHCDRPPRQIVHSDADGFWMQRPRGNGHAHPRDVRGPHSYDPYCPIDVVLRAPADLHTLYRSVLLQEKAPG